MHNILFFLWYKIPRLILIPFLPLSFIFYIIIYLRRFLLLYYFKRFTSKARVIIVGNLVVGGSGKTPFTIWLSKYLESKDKKTTIISSGYGSTISSPVIIDSLSNPNEVGDEAVLLSDKTQSMVVSSSNRVESTKFCDTNQVDFIIHDDGLQHYSLNRQYEFIIENTNMRDNYFLLPCGPLREPKFFHKNADFILSNYTGSEHPGFYSRISSVSSAVDRTKYDLDDKKFSSCILITAIADDFSLVKELKEHDIELITYKYPDHYQFRESDIPKVDQPILVTEKDFVKIKLFCNENVYILEQNIIPNDKLLKLMEKLS